MPTIANALHCHKEPVLSFLVLVLALLTSGCVSKPSPAVLYFPERAVGGTARGAFSLGLEHCAQYLEDVGEEPLWDKELPEHELVVRFCYIPDSAPALFMRWSWLSRPGLVVRMVQEEGAGNRSLPGIQWVETVPPDPDFVVSEALLGLDPARVPSFPLHSSAFFFPHAPLWVIEIRRGAEYLLFCRYAPNRRLSTVEVDQAMELAPDASVEEYETGCVPIAEIGVLLYEACKGKFLPGYADIAGKRDSAQGH